MRRIDKIKSMDVAELAELLFDIGADENIYFCKNEEECGVMLDTGEGDTLNLMCRQCLIDWLMEEET